MPIYTKTGDKGETGVYGGKRLSKSDPQIDAYGTVDELSSFIGLVMSRLHNREDKEFLVTIQKDLYVIMSKLSGAPVKTTSLKKSITTFEKHINKLERSLPKLNRFILPQGSEMASWFHVLRTICRRAERKVVRRKAHSDVVQYLNRLSDLFFMMARYYGQEAEIST